MWTDLVLDFLKSANYVLEIRKLERADEIDVVKGEGYSIPHFVGSTRSYIDD